LHPAYREAAATEPTVMLTAYPQADKALIDEQAETEMRAVIELVSRVRNIRSELNLKPSESLQLIIGAPAKGLQELFGSSKSLAQIGRLTRADKISVRDSLENVPRAAARAVLENGAEIAVPLEGLIDFAQERERLARERDKLQKEAGKLEAQLANPQFAERAPEEKVREVRERLNDIAQRTAALQQMMEALK
jgi:valyl-tRNA synthetase